MKLRKVTDSDIEVIKRNLKDFKFPVPTLDTCIFKRSVINKDGELLGIGAIKLVGDVYLIFPDGIKPLAKAKAIKLLFKEGLKLSTSFGLTQWHAFIDDDEWVEEVKKHYNFVDIDSKHKLVVSL